MEDSVQLADRSRSPLWGQRAPDGETWELAHNTGNVLQSIRPPPGPG